MTPLRTALYAGAALALAACTTDDPRQGGFFGGLVGLGSGSYRDRVASETEALDAERSRYWETVEGGEELDRTLSARRDRAAGLERQVASLQKEIDGLDAEITSLQQDEDLTSEEVARAEANVALLLDDIARIEAERKAHEQAEALGVDAGPGTVKTDPDAQPQDQVSDLRAYIIKLQEAVDALKATRDRRATEGPPGPDAGIN